MAKDKDVSDSMDSFGKVEPEQGSYDADAVVSKIQQHLKDHGGAGDDVDRDTPPIPEPKKEPAGESDSTPKSEPTDEPADDDEPTPEPDGEPAAGDDKPKVAIPDNHYRALIHSGWKPEKVSSLYEKEPELLLELAEKAYNDVNNLGQQFAKLGRSRIEMDQQKSKQQQPTQQPVQQPTQQGPDLAKLRQQYEDDPFGATVELLKAFGSKSQEPHMQMSIQQPPQPKDELSEDLALAQHLITFFGGDTMEQYKDFYGATYDDSNHPYLSTDHLTAGQQANRQHVLQVADQILAGAAFQGSEMPLQEALAMAHMMVSGPITKQVIRNELVSQVKKKAKGVTLKPTSRKTTVPKKAGEAKTEKELEKDTAARLQRYKEGKPIK